ncbi:GntR family transcriptional regulator [Streptomyces hoynatensis]|uniref:GntR family transcriptional regulator n=1 Tax=Streptomyces hoynatensis TaxID=1141874 RepID=A0A3A9YQY8_9ACTN|nr:GntR family transcriptional regulator [Streptomyces hoynatensis]RKN38365.1 GntR family transcriptional regulator [Streptomyces hoynatensis]
MLLRVQPDSRVPLGEQIAACVRGALADGTTLPGERLPPAREVAASLGVNVHTVLRGYQRLRDEGLIELRRGRGAVVRADESTRGRARLLTAARSLIAEARGLGLADEDVLSLVRTALAAGPAE